MGPDLLRRDLVVQGRGVQPASFDSAWYVVKKLLFALTIAFLLSGALRNLNAAFVCVTSGAGRSVLWPLAMAAALLLGALLTWFASARAQREVTPRFLAATLFCVVAAGYVGYLAFVPVHRFGSAATETPLGVAEEDYPRRGKHTYRMNSYGFRGPEWREVKPPGTVRGVVIGDSMVFGSGVDDGDTIDAALARRLRATHAGTRVEILNLGVKGSNLPGYVELYRAATQRLAPDFVVLFLFLPNDLGELEQPSQADRFGAYSFFTFLLGTNNNPYTLYAIRASEARSDASKLAFLARHVQAIEGIRRSQASAPLFVFLYHVEDLRWTETLRTQLGDGALVVDHAPLPEADFIPGDSHPTPEGNRHFAELIGDAIDRTGVVPFTP
jgi:hypothetical protein